MRVSHLLPVLTAAALAAGCATKREVAAQCPGPSGEQLYQATVGSLDKAFGKRRLGYHVIRNSLSSDAKGNPVLNLERIGPATEDQPEPGQGKRLVVVLRRCTGEVVRFYEP